MVFTLIYKGPLKATTKSNNRKDNKHQIRLCINDQLEELWKHKPYCDFFTYHFEGKKEIIKETNSIKFAPFITEKKSLTAELYVTILSKENPGSIITKSGDIDNRLKTLFDSLRSPSSSNELPSNLQNYSKKYFYTLLDDDSLISKCDIKTGRLLDPSSPVHDCLVIIDVKIVPVNFPLGGLKVNNMNKKKESNNILKPSRSRNISIGMEQFLHRDAEKILQFILKKRS